MNQPLHLLVVDDDEVDVMVLRRALKKAGSPARLHYATDGLEALAALRGSDSRQPIPRPLLILLDINMPRMNGVEFLEELRRDPALQRELVFVMTSSRDEEQKSLVYTYNVAGYVVKSGESDDFVRFAQMLDLYGSLVELP